MKSITFDIPEDAAIAARTPKGQATVGRILDAAIEIMVHEGHASLSMRKVAERLNMRISALQHHFANWEELLQAMITRVTSNYLREINRVLARPARSRLRQFESVLDYLLRDIKSPVSQSLFAQLWALAQTNDFARQAMVDTYGHERAVFEFFIRELNPALEKKEVAQRAALMATQIEGLMLLMPQQSRLPAELSGLEQLCLARTLELAHAPPAA
ncbi:TetR/AcrR family transcriptional regulator [Janthinobacterium sp. PC23-8]|uniref:TetR/AcrR family transcriptional regulator n=1 Tax=Janthinobacterium sp. PC23-8 TaxID=2012679 RepID=UPI0015951103|nr:TetR/AcrR family transcriptional regulator [Janthinobacterium sp. PC23-8]